MAQQRPRVASEEDDGSHQERSRASWACWWTLGAVLAVAALWLVTNNEYYSQDAQLGRLRLLQEKYGGNHLVVLAHGLHGTPHTMRVIHDEFTDKLGPQGVLPYLSVSNWGILLSAFSTADGIEAGGQRLVDEVRHVASQLPGVTKVSFVGLSLGGLYSRYAIHELHLQAKAGKPELPVVNFITIASPHTGVRNHVASIMELVLHLGAAGRTGHQLMMTDAVEEPLLVRMSRGSYADSLRAVPRKVLVAPVRHDDKVPHRSSSLRSSNAPLNATTASGVEILDELPMCMHVVQVYHQPAGASLVEVDACMQADAEVAAAGPVLPEPETEPAEDLDCSCGMELEMALEPTMCSGEDSSSGGFMGFFASSSSAEPAATPASQPESEPVATAAADEEEYDDSHEEAIVAALRGMGGWTNVDVHMGDDWLAPFITHQRVSGMIVWEEPECISRHLLEHHFQV